MNRESPTSSPAVHGDLIEYDDNDGEDIHEAIPTASLSLNYIYLQAAGDPVDGDFEADDEISAHQGEPVVQQLHAEADPAVVAGPSRVQDSLSSAGPSNSGLDMEPGEEIDFSRSDSLPLSSNSSLRQRMSHHYDPILSNSPLTSSEPGSVYQQVQGLPSGSSWDLHRLDVPINSGNWPPQQAGRSAVRSWQQEPFGLQQDARPGQQPAGHLDFQDARSGVSLQPVSSQAGIEVYNAAMAAFPPHNHVDDDEDGDDDDGEQQLLAVSSGGAASKAYNSSGCWPQSSGVGSNTVGKASTASSIQQSNPGGSSSSSAGTSNFSQAENRSQQPGSVSRGGVEIQQQAAGPSSSYLSKSSYLSQNVQLHIVPAAAASSQQTSSSSPSSAPGPSRTSSSVYNNHHHHHHHRQQQQQQSGGGGGEASLAPRGVTSSSSTTPRFSRSSLENGETLHLGDVSITRASSAQQQTSRSVNRDQPSRGVSIRVAAEHGPVAASGSRSSQQQQPPHLNGSSRQLEQQHAAAVINLELEPLPGPSAGGHNHLASGYSSRLSGTSRGQASDEAEPRPSEASSRLQFEAVAGPSRSQFEPSGAGPSHSRQQPAAAKRSINFPDSRQFLGGSSGSSSNKRSRRLLDHETMRPDSPSDHQLFVDNSFRPNSGGSGVGGRGSGQLQDERSLAAARSFLLPDDDCDNEPVVSAPPSSLDVDHDRFHDDDDADMDIDRPSSQSDFLNAVVGSRAAGSSNDPFERLTPVSEGNGQHHRGLPESRLHARVGSTDFLAPSPAESSDREWEASDLVSGSDMPASISGGRMNNSSMASRRTLSESSEAEGTVTYGRELYLGPLHVNTNNSRPDDAVGSGGGENNSLHVSPSGSEVSEAGPSHRGGGGPSGSGGGGASARQPTPASPTESDVSAAESTSQNRATDHSNPNSPSGSEVDEPGPSFAAAVGVGHHHVVGMGGANYAAAMWQHAAGSSRGQGFSREAAPLANRYSPEPNNRYRSRNRYSDQCVISSSTGPADSNPPTPEYDDYDHSGDIDNEVPSPPMAAAAAVRGRHFVDEEGDNVVDSTVDSTSGGNFIIPSPIYIGNEAEHEGDSDSDMNDSESIPGSEASSTTASLHEPHHLYLPGFDDNEGISTSGQIDDGSFRLVPNENEDEDGNHAVVASNNPQAEPVPDVQASISSDESIGQLSDGQGEHDVGGGGGGRTFKRPPNRKGRLLQGYEVEENIPVAGPSSRSSHGLPILSQGSVSLTLISSDSFSSAVSVNSSSGAAGSSNAASGSSSSSSSSDALAAGSSRSSGDPAVSGPSVSLFSLKQSGSEAAEAASAVCGSSGYSGSSGGDGGSSVSSKVADFLSSSSYAESLGIGHAFSGLPSSLTDPWDGTTADTPPSPPPPAVTAADKGSSLAAVDSKRTSSSSSNSWDCEDNSSKITGPLAKRIKTKHLQEIALSESVTLTQTSSGSKSAPGGVSGGGEQLASSLEVRPGPSSVPGGASSQASVNNSERPRDEHSASVSIVALAPILQSQDSNDEPVEVLPENLDLLQNPDHEGDDEGEGEGDSVEFLGGTQHSFNIRLEHNTAAIIKQTDLPDLKLKDDLSDKSADYSRVLFCFDPASLESKDDPSPDLPGIMSSSGLSHKDDPAADLPTTLSDAINEVDVSGEETDLFADSASGPGKSGLPQLIIKSGDNNDKKTREQEMMEEEKNQEHLPAAAWAKQDGGSSGGGNPVHINTVDSAVVVEDSLAVTVDVDLSGDLVVGLPEPQQRTGPGLRGDDHTVTVSEEKSDPYVCKYCDKRFMRRTSLNTHVRMHRGFKKYTCQVCDQKFGQAAALRAHKRRVHRSAVEADASGDGGSSCGSCGLAFGSQILLKIHQFCHNPDKEKQNWSVEDALAQQQQQQRHQGQQLQQHKHRRDLDNNTVVQADINGNQEGGGERVPDVSSCEPKILMKSEDSNSTPGRPVEVSRTGDFSSSSSMMDLDDGRHGNRDSEITGAAEMKFECPGAGCGSQYDAWLQLVEHVTDQHAAYPLHHHSAPHLNNQLHHQEEDEIQKCGLCYKVFSTEERLMKHMRVHVKDENKPLKCDTCGKGFLTNSALAGHVKSHANIQFDCPICLRKFLLMTQLKDHVYEHKENGVFTCPYCMKVFTEYQPIRKHIRSYHSQARCKICKAEFPSQAKLRKHLTTHSTTTQERQDFEAAEVSFQISRDETAETSSSAVNSDRQAQLRTVSIEPVAQETVRSVGQLDENRRLAGQSTIAVLSANGLREAAKVKQVNDKATPSQAERNKAQVEQSAVGTAVKEAAVKRTPPQASGQQPPSDRRVNNNNAAAVNTTPPAKAIAVKSAPPPPATVPVNVSGQPHVATDRSISGQGTEKTASGKTSGGTAASAGNNAVNLDNFPFRCDICKLGFKRRGMLVNHMAKRHPTIELTAIPELNQPIVRAEKDFYCQYCPKIYKSSSKRKAHILKKHPGQPLPASVRDVDSDSAAFALAVGSKSSLPFSCSLCHKQYADKAKLWDHQRRDHPQNYLDIRDEEVGGDTDCASTSRVNSVQDKDSRLDNGGLLYLEEPNGSGCGTSVFSSYDEFLHLGEQQPKVEASVASQSSSDTLTPSSGSSSVTITRSSSSSSSSVSLARSSSSATSSSTPSDNFLSTVAAGGASVEVLVSADEAASRSAGGVSLYAVGQGSGDAALSSSHIQQEISRGQHSSSADIVNQEENKVVLLISSPAVVSGGGGSAGNNPANLPSHHSAATAQNGAGIASSGGGSGVVTITRTAPGGGADGSGSSFPHVAVKSSSGSGHGVSGSGNSVMTAVSRSASGSGGNKW